MFSTPPGIFTLKTSKRFALAYNARVKFYRKSDMIYLKMYWPELIELTATV